MMREATCIRSGIRNFTAGIERASSPRRKRITVWSSPWRAMSTPMTSGAGGSFSSARATAPPMRWLSMNCIEPARGATPLTRTSTKSESLAVVLHPGGDLGLVGHGDLSRIDLARRPAMAEAAAGETFAEAACAPRRIAEHGPEQLGARIGQRAFDGLPHRVGNG